ncbi:MAG: glucose-6-phosphate isomerase family protein [Anaerolineae bacterium]
MSSTPAGYLIADLAATGGPEAEHVVRRLSAMQGAYDDRLAYQAALAQGDAVVYEVHQFIRPEAEGELLSGLSVLHPGRVGSEYFMTKGHFHARLATAEVYYCLQGQGLMVMEAPEGEWAVESLYPGHVLHVPPRWAHRSVNVSADQDLVIFYVYPADAGHDYGTIERQGFRKLIVEGDGQPTIVDNPRWRRSET